MKLCNYLSTPKLIAVIKGGPDGINSQFINHNLNKGKPMIGTSENNYSCSICLFKKDYIYQNLCHIIVICTYAMAFTLTPFGASSEKATELIRYRSLIAVGVL